MMLRYQSIVERFTNRIPNTHAIDVTTLQFFIFHLINFGFVYFIDTFSVSYCHWPLDIRTSSVHEIWLNSRDHIYEANHLIFLVVNRFQ